MTDQQIYERARKVFPHIDIEARKASRPLSDFGQLRYAVIAYHLRYCYEQGLKEGMWTPAPGPRELKKCKLCGMYSAGSCPPEVCLQNRRAALDRIKE